MENITLGQLATAVAFFVAFFTGISYLLKNVKTAIKTSLKSEFEPINKKLDALEKQVGNVDMESCKNFLVACISDIDKGVELGEVEKERFLEQYEHYQKIGGNSYIKSKVDKLQKEGKL